MKELSTDQTVGAKWALQISLINGNVTSKWEKAWYV